MKIDKSKHVVKSFPTFPQRAGKVDEQIMRFMENWINEENELLIVEKMVPHQANTADGLEQMILVVFERHRKR